MAQKPMTKSQLIAALAEATGSDKKSAGASLEGLCALITSCLLYTSDAADE